MALQQVTVSDWSGQAIPADQVVKVEIIHVAENTRRKLDLTVEEAEKIIASAPYYTPPAPASDWREMIVA